MSVVILSTGYYPDPDIGKPIANGYIYVGTVDLDPEIVANQKTISVLQEDGTEVAVTQPLRTSAGGVPTYNGSPVTIIAASPYSLLVKDSEDVQKIYSPSNTGSSQANEDWTEEGAAVAFDSASTFTVVGDVTADYPTHRAIKLTQTLDDTGFVVSSVFGAVTTVTVRAATVDSGLTKVEYGIEVDASPGGSEEDFYADIVADEVDVDVINEKTAAAGVTIDGVLCKDSVVTADLVGNADTATKVGGLNVSTIEIGDWDMDASASFAIVHGLGNQGPLKIRALSAMVVNDAISSSYPAAQGNIAGDGTVGTEVDLIAWVSNTEVKINRRSGSIFDSTNFADVLGTQGNRGWVTIWYID